MNMFLLFIRYFWAILVHKYYILLAGTRMNEILVGTSYEVSYNRLLLHDLSKFSRSEFWPYAEHFYGGKKHEEEFHQAWLHHVHHNDHHWEHFIDNYPLISKQLSSTHQLDNLTIHPMPDDAILEMIADNLAASRSYDGYWPDGKKKDGWKWMTNSFNKHQLHPITRIKFAAFLNALGYAAVLPEQFDWIIIEKVNLSNDEKRKLLQLKTLAQLNN